MTGRFEDLGVLPEIIRATEDMEWSLPTDVQDEAIPLILGGGHVMIAAETGSGKTGSFAIPVIQLIWESLRGVAKVTEVEEASFCPQDGKQCAWDNHDRNADIAIGSDGCTVQHRVDGAWSGVRANTGFVKGRHYYEGTVMDEGLSRIGWGTAECDLNIGTDTKSFGYGGTAKKSHAKQFIDYGEKYVKGATVGSYIDLDAHTIGFTKDGKDLGVAFPIPPNLHGVPLYPAVSLKNAEMKFNFGSQPFKSPQKFPGCTEASAEEISAKAKPNVKKPQGAKPAGGGGGILALIIEPTQELASQVHNEIEKFVKYLDPPVVPFLITGQIDHSAAKGLLKTGVHIVTGTLGALRGYLSKGLNLSTCSYLILDEADSLLEQGAKTELMHIYNKCPHESVSMQVVICSATLHSSAIAELAEQIAKNALWVDLKGKDSVPETVDHTMILVDPRTDDSWRKPLPKGLNLDLVHEDAIKGSGPDELSYGVKALKPQIVLQLIDTFKMTQCIIFCRTRIDCDNLASFLTVQGGGQAGTASKIQGEGGAGKENRYSCRVLHGGKGAGRQDALDDFKDGLVRFLIATDVAARGIDVQGLPFVINMTLPDPSDQYIHRIGRVGRAGCPGMAISLIGAVKEKVWYHKCNRTDNGAGCRNRALLEQGGCCKWYDELTLKAEIETRLSAGKENKLIIPFVDRNKLSLGSDMLHRMAQLAAGANKGSKELEVSLGHVAALRPQVSQLAALEFRVQQNYLEIFNNPRWLYEGASKETHEDAEQPKKAKVAT